MWPNSENVVDNVFYANDVAFTKVVLYELVVLEGNALAVDFTVTTLVYELANGLEIRISVCNEWFHQVKHLHHRFRHSDEHGIVELTQTQQFQDLAGLRAHTIDTSNTDNDGKLGLGRYEEGTERTSSAFHSNLLFLLHSVFLRVLFCTFEDVST